MNTITDSRISAKKTHEDAQNQETQEDIEKVLKAAWALVQVLDGTIDKGLPQELASIVKLHAKGAAIIAALIAWVPAVGPITALLLSAICVWSMYLRINKKINLPLAQNLFKTVISGIAGNIAANLSGLIVVTAISFILTIGNFAADVIMVAVTYAVTLGAGIVYLKVLTRVFKARKDPVSLSLEHVKEFAEKAKEHDDLKPYIEEAKASLRGKKVDFKAAINAKIIECINNDSTDLQRQLEDAYSEDKLHVKSNASRKRETS